jgi:hypothetical protein
METIEHTFKAILITYEYGKLGSKNLSNSLATLKQFKEAEYDIPDIRDYLDPGDIIRLRDGYYVLTGSRLAVKIMEGKKYDF